MSGNSQRIAEIIDRFGGQTALARDLECSQGTVWEWIEKGSVPSARIVQIIAAGQRHVPAVHLEPNDFFPRVTAEVV